MKINIFTIGLLVIFLSALPVISFDGQQAGAELLREPVLVTTVGQNPDGLIVKVVLQGNGIQFDYLPLADRESLTGYNSLIMTVGLSRKGLRAARTTYQSELLRAADLIEEAGEGELPVIVVHLGGGARRDEESNGLLAAAAPHSSFLVVSDESDYDGYFTRLSEKQNIPLKVMENLANLRNFFAGLARESSQNGGDIKE